MQRSTLTLVVVLALILGSAGLWWSLQDGSARRGADMSDPPAASQTQAEAAAPVDLTGAQSPERADPALATETLQVGAVQREAVPTAAEAAPRPTIQLRVVDAGKL